GRIHPDLRYMKRLLLFLALTLTLVASGQDDNPIGPVSQGGGAIKVLTVGSLPPIFSSAIAGSATHQTITFTLSPAAAHSFLGNNTGSPAPPGYFQLTSSDLVDFSNI